jgi:glycosyltransferase involved in cell wall biosynthesis
VVEEGYPFISVVITGKNPADTIEECLLSVIRNNYPLSRFEIIYVDGGSMNGTLEIVKRISEAYRDKVPIKWYIEIGPPGKGRNRGVLEAKGEIIAFTDSDVIVDQNWLRNPARYKGMRVVDHNPTCNAAYWKWVFEKVGLFREDLPVTEDVELDTRIRKSGYLLLYADDIVVWHRRRKTLKSFIRQMYSYGYWRAYSGRRRLIPLSLVHFAPSGFLLYLLIACPAAAAFGSPLLLVPIAAYAFFGLSSGLYAALKRGDPKLAAAVPALGFLEHVAYGAGFIAGFLAQPKQ